MRAFFCERQLRPLDTVLTFHLCSQHFFNDSLHVKGIVYFYSNANKALKLKNMNCYPIGVQTAVEMQADRVNYLFLYLILNDKLKVNEDRDRVRMATYVRAHLFNVREDNTCTFDLQVLGHAGYPGGENSEKLCSAIVSMEFSVLTFLMASLSNEIDELIESRP